MGKGKSIQAHCGWSWFCIAFCSTDHRLRCLLRSSPPPSAGDVPAPPEPHCPPASPGEFEPRSVLFAFPPPPRVDIDTANMNPKIKIRGVMSWRASFRGSMVSLGQTLMPCGLQSTLCIRALVTCVCVFANNMFRRAPHSGAEIAATSLVQYGTWEWQGNLMTSD